MGNDDWWWWIYSWLVVDLPLWKIWVRRLGWRHSQYMEKQNMFKTTNQCWFVLPARHTKWIPSALLLLISFLRKMSENRIHHSTYSKNWWNDDWHCNFWEQIPSFWTRLHQKKRSVKSDLALQKHPATYHWSPRIRWAFYRKPLVQMMLNHQGFAVSVFPFIQIQWINQIHQTYPQ